MTPSARDSSDTPAVAESSPDEIVVATPHVPRVLRLLGAADVLEIESHDGVGLTRLVLKDVDEAAERFARTLRRSLVLPGSRTPLRARSPIEQVLAGVRLTFADQWDGWFPRMGKNRVMVGGQGAPIMIIRGDGPPEGDVPASDLPVPRAGGTGVTVGLLDTPVRHDLTFDGRLLEGSSRLDATETAAFIQGHGTFTTGLVHQQAGDAGLLVRGVLAGRDATATAWDVALALFDLVTQSETPVHIVNMSLGCFTEDNRPPLVLAAAVEMVRDDVVLLAAGGNHGRQPTTQVPTNIAPLWPAALDGVVAVGGRLRSGGDYEPAPFTPRTPWLNVLTDGTDLVSTYLDGKVSLGSGVEQFDGVARWSGSSMASAVAAGRLAALADGEGGARGALARLVAGTPDEVLTVYAAPDAE